MKKVSLILIAILLCFTFTACSTEPKVVDVVDQEITLALSFGERAGTYTGETIHMYEWGDWIVAAGEAGG